MWLSLYLVSLTASSGLVGIYIQRILASAGYAPDFQVGVTLAVGFAAAFAASQLLYVALVQLLKATKAKSFYITESLSQAAAVLLLPELIGKDIAWPIPALETVQPFIFLGLFAAVHMVFKFMSFFAALQGVRGKHVYSLVWAAAGVVFAFAGMTMLRGWVDSVRSAMPEVPGEAIAYRVSDIYRSARAMREGSVYTGELASYPGQCLTLAWAPPPANDDTSPVPERIYVTIYLYGDETKRVAQSIKLAKSGWTEMRIPSEIIPNGVKSCTISWGRKKEPPWQRFISFRPVVTAPQTLLLAGPLNHEQRNVDSSWNFVVLAIDGLSAEHASYLGYKRRTTPSLDSLANAALTFPLTYTPSPDPAAANTSLMTGLGPLKHGVLGSEQGPLREEIDTLARAMQRDRYMTAAFMESPAETDSIFHFGNGLERGFDVYDVATDNEGDPKDRGSGDTVLRALRWVEKHAEHKFFVYARLGELNDLALKDRYGNSFHPKDTDPSDTDVYDSAVQYLDRHIGELVRWIRDHDTRRNTCIIIAGTYGNSPTQDSSVALDEARLRVPLLVYVPGRKKEPREDIVGLEDVYSAIMGLARLKYAAALDGKDFLAGPISREPIAVCREPFALSIRTPKWRCTWATPLNPDATSVTLVSTGRAPVVPPGIQLFDMSRLGRDRVQRDVASKNVPVVNVFLERLETYAQTYRKSTLSSQ
jgi:hypothetical protein